MSVDFTAAAATTQYVDKACDFPGCCEEERCGSCQEGIMQERVSDAPELNLNNGNAAIVIRVLGLDPPDMWGKLATEQLPAIRRRIMYLRNRPLALASYARETADTRRPGQCRVVCGGIDAQVILDRLERLDAVLAWAQERNSEVLWG